MYHKWSFHILGCVLAALVCLSGCAAGHAPASSTVTTTTVGRETRPTSAWTTVTTTQPTTTTAITTTTTVTTTTEASKETLTTTTAAETTLPTTTTTLPTPQPTPLPNTPLPTPLPNTPLLTVACFTDIHVMSAMLDMDNLTVRQSVTKAVDDILARQGAVDLAFVGGDTMSDYPHWNQSCAMPYENFAAMRQKIAESIGRVTKTGQVMYVAGNHDFALGELPTTGKNGVYNSTDYYTYPMKGTLGELTASDSYWSTSKELSGKTGQYLMAYHYTFNGLHFIGMNPHPDDMFYDNDGFYDADTVAWVADKLDEIDPDGKTPVFVLGHFPTMTRKLGIVTKTVSDDEMDLLHTAFDGHQNLFYFYGHVHGEEYAYQQYTAESILHYKAGVTKFPVGAGKTASSSYEVLPQGQEGNFTTVHMGGMRPFDKKYFENDAVSGYGGNDYVSSRHMTATPKLAQYLVFTVYADRVEFQMYNAGSGSLKGYTDQDILQPYTVYFR